MTKKQLLNDRKLLLDEIAQLQAENLTLRLGPRDDMPPVPDSPEEEEAQAQRAASYSRFPQLRAIDEAYADQPLPEPLAPKAFARPDAANGAAAEDTMTTATAAASAPQLSQVAEHLRRYAAAHFGLYADRSLFACFLGAMAASDLVLLRSAEESPNALLLCQASAAAFGQSLCLTQVPPGWEEPADLLGALDSQTGQYRETPFLCSLYEACYQTAPCFTALEGINASPPERYLSSLLPVTALRGVPTLAGMRELRLAETAWPGDPLLLRRGALPYPEALWLFGTLMPASPLPAGRLRDCAMEFCLPPLTEKSFLVSLAKPMELSAQTLRALFLRAEEVYAMPEEALRLFALLEQHLAEHMDLSLGSAMASQLRRFGSVCLACGLRISDILDGFLYHRALCRLPETDPAVLKFELPALRRFLLRSFGKKSLPLTMEFLEQLT